MMVLGWSHSVTRSLPNWVSILLVMDDGLGAAKKVSGVPKPKESQSFL